MSMPDLIVAPDESADDRVNTEVRDMPLPLPKPATSHVAHLVDPSLGTSAAGGHHPAHRAG